MKWKRSAKDQDGTVSKRLRMDVNVTSNEDSEFPSDLQNESIQDELHNACQTKRYIPHHLLELMYQLDLSVLCSLRKSTYENKYPLLSLAFKDSEIDKFNDIALRYEEKSIHIRIENVDKYYTDNDINYAKLFTKGKQSFSINSYFDSFVKHLTSKLDSSLDNIEYLVIYTNSGLDLTEEKELRKGRSRNFYPFKFDSINLDLTEEKRLNKGRSKDFYSFKFDSIDIKKKRYKILRDCSCINGNGLYRFAQEETTREKLLSLLKLLPSLQEEKEGRLSNENERETKEKFLDKLIFAVNQPNKEELNSIIRNEIDKSHNVPYNYEKLHEIALRWSESHEFGTITKGVMEKLLGDIKNNRSRCQKIQKNIGEEIKFAKSVVGREGTSAFYQFLVFLVKGKGRKCLEVLKREGINLSSISGILSGAGGNAAKAFKDLYDLWFDAEGNKTKYLKTLEEKEINLANISSVLNKARIEAAKAFKDLYDRWFNQDGEKTRYLIKLEENRVDLARISSILSGAGGNAAKAFNDLYDLWFDAEGNKTKYLKTLEEKEINLVSMSSILHRAGGNAAKAFKDLYNLWFDAKGNETQYLKTLGAEGINLTNMSSVLAGAGANAAEAFKDLHDSWFDGKGNIKQYLKHFIEKKDEKESFTLHNLSSMLSGAGINAEDAFKKLHDVCFNDEGKRTELLDDFYKVGFNASNLSCVLRGARARVSSLLKKLHSVCFNKKKEKTKLLDDFYKAGFKSSDLCSILSGAAGSLEKFHNFCFMGETKEYLNHFFREGFTPTDLSRVLHGARANVCSALKDFHDAYFDQTGNKARLLDDFYKKGFRPIDLSNVLSLTGNNATLILRNFHRLCFNKENYLNHFLAKKKLFTPQNLSKMLEGIGTKVCLTFEKLHDLCFDKAGNKTSYLNDLIEHHPSREIPNILREKIRKAPSTFLDGQNISEEGKATNAGPTLSNSYERTEQEQNLDSLQQSDPKRKTQKGSTNRSKNRQDDKILDTVAGRSCSLRDLSPKQIHFEQQLDSATNSLPSNLIYTKGYKTLSGLSNYIAEIKGVFAVHLVTSNHVIAIYRTDDNYTYFDTNAAFVSGLKRVDQLMQVVEKAVKFAGYEVGEKGFLIEHFDVDKANDLLSDEDKQVLTKEIETERQLLPEQDKDIRFIKINGQELSRVHLYNFGTKINVEGDVPLLISSDMNLSSKKFQDHLDKKEISMTAREYLDHLKDSKNVEEVIQATKIQFLS
ncbi:hypothetical protein AVEN_263017-1 [Araneus ventricosus]|uniref:Uncharacterized protein n=1 Tax=Araneus ventricosus TaxID=182803 RepID=A0A4Y2P9C4_ARAVE|nr:hypothetical protein AVEN_263017-1 [Araneus ventricosus]